MARSATAPAGLSRPSAPAGAPTAGSAAPDLAERVELALRDLGLAGTVAQGLAHLRLRGRTARRLPTLRLCAPQAREQPAALGAEQVGDRAGLAEVDQGRVDPALERRLVLDQVEAKAGELALLSDPRVGKPDRRDQVPLAERRQDPRVDLVGLAGQRSEAP